MKIEYNLLNCTMSALLIAIYKIIFQQKKTNLERVIFAIK